MKNLAIETIRKYLPNLTIKEGELKKSGIKLPAIYNSLYRFEELLINGNPYLVINVKEKDAGPRQFKKHGKVISEQLNYPQIWFVKDLHFHKVQRMIENGLDFIVNDKQVYLPSINVSIKAERELIKPVIKELNGLSVSILIRQLLKGDLTGKNKFEIASLFFVNQMTVGRAIEPLLNLDLCYETKIGVSKLLHFKDRNELWKFFKTNVRSPVEQIVFLKKAPVRIPFSGITALSEAGMLADDRIKTFCTSKKSYKVNFFTEDLELEEFAVAKLEVWNREPLFVEDKRINSLDCFLILKDDQDERVQIELENILKREKLDL